MRQKNKPATKNHQTRQANESNAKDKTKNKKKEQTTKQAKRRKRREKNNKLAVDRAMPTIKLYVKRKIKALSDVN